MSSSWKPRTIPSTRIWDGQPAIMLDIETVGKHANAPFYELGAIKFKWDRMAGKCVTLGKLHELVNPASQIASGAEPDDSTMKWTMGKPDRKAAYEKAKVTGVDVVQLHALLGTQIDAGTVVFCNGLAFDVTILEQAFHRARLKAPWAYYNVADLRDMVTAAELISGDQIFNAARPASHDGLDDCVRQVDMLEVCLRHMCQPRMAQSHRTP